MQVFKLVQPGVPDRLIAFDTLPAEYVRPFQTRTPAGLPRHWGRWLKENGSVDNHGEPIFFLAEYQMVNNDREAWQNITQYARRIVDTRFRLLDHIEQMAAPMAKDSRSEMTLEPEDVPVIPVSAGELETVPAESAIEESSRRGRKPKEA